MKKKTEVKSHWTHTIAEPHHLNAQTMSLNLAGEIVSCSAITFSTALDSSS
jgi:hypothetical protein